MRQREAPGPYPDQGPPPLNPYCDYAECACHALKRGDGIAHVSNRLRIIWYENPKVASGSIKKLLGLPQATPTNPLIRCGKYRFSRKEPTDHLRYFKFGVVRNPWDRFVSAYEMFKTCPPYYTKDMKFRDFVRKVRDGEIKNHHWEPQTHWVNPFNMNIFHYENLQEDLRPIIMMTDVKKLSHRNKNLDKKPFMDYYRSKDYYLVGEMYQGDVELFGY
jgi:hypothetical protein